MYNIRQSKKAVVECIKAWLITFSSSAISLHHIILITTQQLHKQLSEESDAFTKQIRIAFSLLLFYLFIYFCKSKWSGEGLIAAAASPFQFKRLSVTLLKWNKYILNELWYFANLFLLLSKTSKHAESTGQRHSIVLFFFSFNRNRITRSTYAVYTPTGILITVTSCEPWRNDGDDHPVEIKFPSNSQQWFPYSCPK